MVEDADPDVATVGATLAAIEIDCAKNWPVCPRISPQCDCRLRAVRVVNALKLTGRL